MGFAVFGLSLLFFARLSVDFDVGLVAAHLQLVLENDVVAEQAQQRIKFQNNRKCREDDVENVKDKGYHSGDDNCKYS
jgi:hypothetical protein